MSGIVCLFDRDGGTVARESVADAADAIAHRGPSGAGLWRDSRVGLGHQHLRTTPESTYDDQPARNDDFVIVADARVDNRTELIESLGVTDSPSRVPDSQLLLKAYREWGPDCVEHILGAFSFAVWDAEADRVFCARDHFGVKPLYYHLSDGLFAVASEPKALLAVPTVPTDIDDLKIGDFLLHRFEGKTRSFFDSVRRLPPASAMSVSPADGRTWQYWDLDPTQTITLDSDAAYERRFRELFEQAVECRLRTDGRVGTDLSGGLDSSSVTVTARSLLPDDELLYTFSDVYDDAPASDEREFIELVAERDGVSSTYIFLDETGVLVDINSVLQYFDHPPYDATHFGKWERAKRISDAGAKIHLKGEMGDETVSDGLGYLPELFRKGQWSRLNRELNSMGEVTGASPKQLLMRNALRPLVPMSAIRTIRKLQGKPILVEAANPTLDPAFVRENGLRKRFKCLEPAEPALRHTARGQQYRSLTSGRLTARFETIDLIDAAFGIEPRYPFADVRLVEYSLAIPPSQQLADGYTRSILRRSIGDLLPEKIQWRPWKAMPGQAVENAVWNEQSRLEQLVENPGRVTAYLDEQALRESYEQFLKDGDSLNRRSLYKALSLSAWLGTRGVDTALQ